MDGYQLAEEVGKDYPQLKIQMVSGFSDKRYVGKNLALHNRRLQKPFSAETLLQRIRDLMDQEEIAPEIEMMHPIEWSDEISTDIEQVDSDHKVLLSLLNQCIRSAGNTQQDEEISTILEKLLDYTNYHFRREEVIMDTCNYPNLAAHKQAHQTMIDGVNKRIREFRDGKLEGDSLLEFLKNWLINHIIRQDRDIIPYCQGKRVLIEKALRDAGLNHSTDA
jgi:hemerythrin